MRSSCDDSVTSQQYAQAWRAIRAKTREPSPRTTPALMQRSIAAQGEHGRFRSFGALRCVSKHEGAHAVAVLIFRDARDTRSRLRHLLHMRAPQDEDEYRVFRPAHHFKQFHHCKQPFSFPRRVFARHSGARAKPASPESIPTASGYGFRPSPLSRLGRNDQLKALASNNTSSFPRRVFAPGFCFSLRSPGMRGGRSTERRTGARAKHPVGVP